MEELDRLTVDIPQAARILQRVELGAGSGTETRVRLMLRRLRIRFVTQCVIRGVGRVDFLIGDRLILEVDSRSHHTSLEHYAKDRRRDAEAAAMGFMTMRTTFEEVMYDLAVLEQRILAIVRSRDHLWTARNARWRRHGLPHPVVA